MDAIDIGTGNELLPSPRKLGLLIMGHNPLAVDFVGARLLGYKPDDVPYLKQAVERGYAPESIEQVKLLGDITTIAGLEKHAERVMPYDEGFHRWHDIEKELERLESPLRFVWGPSLMESSDKCMTGCIMALKTFLRIFECYAGAEAFRTARPAVLVVGRPEETIDAHGNDVFIIGTCSAANVVNARKIKHVDKCFTTVSDMICVMGGRLGILSPTHVLKFLLPMFYHIGRAGLQKVFSGRYFQDTAHFFKKTFIRKV